ncbi:MAG: DUF3160 domain-containing protein [Pseudobdellovibrionaceae bacterium]
MNIISLLLLMALSGLNDFAAASPFDFQESAVETSPQNEKSLKLEKDEVVVDFDVSPIRPEAAVVIKDSTGKQKVLFWNFGPQNADRADRAIDVPSELTLSAITWHPLGHALFFLAMKGNEQEILKTPSDSWKSTLLYRSKNTLRRLVVGPRPFEIGYDEKTKTSPTRYRVFFGLKKTNGNYSTHTITEDGQREYAVLDSKPDSLHLADSDVQPNVLIAKSALPAGFHPAGHFMLWEDEKNCFQKAEYGRDNWSSEAKVVDGNPICKGSLTYTPNGAALLQWQGGRDGVTLRLDRGEKSLSVAKNYMFISTPSSVADGRGVVGVTKEGAVSTIRYVPIDVPLTDVVNAWMYLESPRDREFFSTNTGLFRALKNNQLYELYDSESYHCGDYDQSTPSRPYFVTTDIFWELYAAAFEGTFILSEKQAAIPNFWRFAQAANETLKNQPQSKMARAFAAILAVREGGKLNPEAAKILKSEGVSHSSITNEDFDFGNLKPRSHYVADPTLQSYFRASKYLMDLKLDDEDTAILKRLPKTVTDAALSWINVYIPFIAPSKRPLVWEASTPVPQVQVFPLSWGIDNEVLFSTVYHQNLPESEQIKGPGGLRMLPSGLDLAAVLGSKIAESILEESGEFQKYPPLKTQIESLTKRFAASKIKSTESLYQKWLAGLAAQWSENITSPDDAIQKKFWSRKRLQTGLASWATLRHATLLVNERSEAECGEAGFEQIVLRPPRGYVEPDPATFDAIAGLFDAIIEMVKAHGRSWVGNSPKSYGDADLGLQGGILRRLTESRDKARLFRSLAQKELEGKALTNQEYEDILYVGRAAEHNFLIFKSLAQKDFALSTPDPVAKVADVAGSAGSLLLAGVGNPIEWDQVVPFFGRKQIVKGSSYSYYESVSNQVMNDAEWRSKISTLPRPKWIEPYFSKESLSCPAKAP